MLVAQVTTQPREVLLDKQRDPSEKGDCEKGPKGESGAKGEKVPKGEKSDKGSSGDSGEGDAKSDKKKKKKKKGGKSGADKKSKKIKKNKKKPQTPLDVAKQFQKYLLGESAKARRNISWLRERACARDVEYVSRCPYPARPRTCSCSSRAEPSRTRRGNASTRWSWPSTRSTRRCSASS